MGVKCCLTRSGCTGILRLGGSLTAWNVEDIGEELHFAINLTEGCTIDLEGVTEMDQTGLRLLCRCLGDSLREKKILLLQGKYLARVQHKLGNGDLSCPAVCRKDVRECVFRARCRGSRERERAPVPLPIRIHELPGAPREPAGRNVE